MSGPRQPAALVEREQQVIKVGNVYAAWIALAVQPEGQSLPARLITYCVLSERGCESRIVFNRVDVRPGRTANDFDEFQAQFLRISRSFRLTKVEEQGVPDLQMSE